MNASEKMVPRPSSNSSTLMTNDSNLGSLNNLTNGTTSGNGIQEYFQKKEYLEKFGDELCCSICNNFLREPILLKVILFVLN